MTDYRVISNTRAVSNTGAVFNLRDSSEIVGTLQLTGGLSTLENIDELFKTLLKM